MLSIVKYSYLNSKIKAKTSKRLSKHDYNELVTKKTVNEVTSYLKHKTSYGKVLSDINEQNVHRGDLEKVLKNAQFRRCQKLMKLIKGKESNFMKYNIMRYEIEDLKMMIRTLHIHHSLEEVEPSLFILEKSNINLKKLLASTTLTELVNGLQGTEYYKILFPLIESDNEASMFTIEMALDLYYFRWIIRAKEHYLKGEDRRVITRSVGEEIDVLNLLWIYRMNKFYHMDKELVYRYLIPGNYHISKVLIQRMIETEHVDDLLKLYHNTIYASIFDDDSQIYFDYNYRKYVSSLHEKLLKTKPFSIASIISYLHVKEVELNNIITIIESIRYGLRPEKIKRMIVQ